MTGRRLNQLDYGALKLVGKVGFEPTHPKEPDLQSGATLQLRRLPIFILNSGAPTLDRTEDSGLQSRSYTT